MQELITWNFRNKLLVTGTPLQNSLKELWALLHFLTPQKFHNCEDFEARYDTNSADGVTALHAELRPHLLRRVIKVLSQQLFNMTHNTLLHFLTPQKFHNCEDFEARYDTNSADGVTALLAELRPHLLRRVIKVLSQSLLQQEHLQMVILESAS